MSKTKQCSECGKVKTISRFYAHRSRCKLCWRKMRKNYYYTVQKASPFFRIKKRIESKRKGVVNSHEQ